MTAPTNRTVTTSVWDRFRLRDGSPLPLPAIWAARGFGFLWVGLLTLLAQWQARDRLTLVIQICGYAIIGAVSVVWAVLEARRPAAADPGPAILTALGAVAAISGVLSMSHNGALLVLFACIAALSAGGDSPLGPAVGVTCVGILGVMAGAVLFSSANAAELIGYPITMLSALLMGRHRRTYRVKAQQAAELLERTRELQVQQRRADVLDERARIAREIHDVLAHSLGALGIQIQAARAVLTDSGDVDKALEVLGSAQRMAMDGLTETRRAVHALRAGALVVDEELRTLAGVHTGRYGAEVGFVTTGEGSDLSPAVALALLRVAQEALVNAAKHAPGQPVELTLAYQPDEVCLTVRNPVAPYDTGSDARLRTLDGGYGLTGMHERLLLLDGTLEAGERNGHWTVSARLPHTHVGPED